MKVICYGDSNTYGFDPRFYFGDCYDNDSRWVDILSEKTGWSILNQGENGREIPKAAVSFPADTDWLIIMLGTNELLQMRDPKAISMKMQHFLSGLNLPQTKILLIAPPPMVFGEWVPSQK